ncbi:hypothetical protein LV457_07750 [Mycobacterium sp. MYCO198283]|uniref:hypothetical protein n=1 Tax=Mycobacterium sp. MYCO198283 TaxID=2883505 RepID=UPI001E4265EA|nr:hypothetical protein [Mycobacterium sp. MYCO198283]MCG5432186.1 hypothetical protein [Mycobacterium sp. MYCO198283]
MKVRLGYVTVEVDDRVRRRIAAAGERLRLWVAGVTAYVRSAGDDVETVGGRVRGMCDAAATRVDSAIERVNSRVAPPEPEVVAPEPGQRPHLRAI